ncbi:hypothetical protein FRB99_007565, partial [Tulasnella sp. 403]
METDMIIGVQGALDGLLSRYLSTTSNLATPDKDTPAITIAEDILSITAKWVLNMKRRWNRALPIYRLPTEILLFIFQLCVPSDEFWLPENHQVMKLDYSPSTSKYYGYLLTLCGVAFDWAQIICDAPNFWVYTSSQDHPRLTELVLERSRTSLLWVKYHAKSMMGAPDSTKRLDKYAAA